MAHPLEDMLTDVLDETLIFLKFKNVSKVELFKKERKEYLTKPAFDLKATYEFQLLMDLSIPIEKKVFTVKIADIIPKLMDAIQTKFNDHGHTKINEIKLVDVSSTSSGYSVTLTCSYQGWDWWKYDSYEEAKSD